MPPSDMSSPDNEKALRGIEFLMGHDLIAQNMWVLECGVHEIPGPMAKGNQLDYILMTDTAMASRYIEEEINFMSTDHKAFSLQTTSETELREHCKIPNNRHWRLSAQ